MVVFCFKQKRGGNPTVNKYELPLPAVCGGGYHCRPQSPASKVTKLAKFRRFKTIVNNELLNPDP